MEFVTGEVVSKSMDLKDFIACEGSDRPVCIEGAIHSIRNMGEIAFIILRRQCGLIQTVWEDRKTNMEISQLHDGDYIQVEGTVRLEPRAVHGRELCIRSITILSRASAPMPLPVAKWKLNTSLETKLNLRPISLRNIRELSRFRIQEGIVRGFRDFLYSQGFTEIHTPKIGAKGAEGGSNIFKLSYFHKPAILEQSPQLYKQMMVGVFDRVFETGPVFRAEKHNTRRHLNEYTSLDFEMGYIESFLDICRMETGFLRHTMKFLEEHYSDSLKLLGITLPKADQIPYVRFDEAKELVLSLIHI